VARLPGGEMTGKRARYNSRHVTDVPTKTFRVEQIWFILLDLLEVKFTLLVEVGETSSCMCSKIN